MASHRGFDALESTVVSWGEGFDTIEKELGEKKIGACSSIPGKVVEARSNLNSRFLTGCIMSTVLAPFALIALTFHCLYLAGLSFHHFILEDSSNAQRYQRSENELKYAGKITLALATWSVIEIVNVVTLGAFLSLSSKK